MLFSEVIRVKRTQRDYSLSFKLSLVEQIEAGIISQKEAKDIYGIQGHSTILSWLRKYGKMVWSNPQLLGEPMSSKDHILSEKRKQDKKIASLEKRIKELEYVNQILYNVKSHFESKYGESEIKKLLKEK